MKEVLEQVRELLLLKNIVFKAVALIFILLCFGYLIDEIIGYSYFSINDKKINQIERIEKLKTTYPKDTLLVSQLNKLKDDIVEYQEKRPKMWSYLPDSLSFNNRSILDNSKTITESKIKIPANKNSNSIIFYQILSTSFLFIIIAIIVPFVMLFEGDDTWKAKLGIFFGISIAFLVVIAANSLFITWLIPDIGNQNLKYAINMFVHFSIIGIVAMINDWYTKKTEKKV